MLLPKNGRVIIIDDEPFQALPLIKALSKNNIPSSYFDAKKESLPINKISDVRIIFLDINLNGGQQPNWATEKGMLIANIVGILAPQTPYILFVWSVNEAEHLNDLKLLFDNELKDYKPIVPLISMDKSQFFKQEVEEEKVKWTLNEDIGDPLVRIKEKIDKGIEDLDSLEALLKWENVVNDAAGEVVNDIIALAAVNAEVNDGLKQIYYNLAHAYWGKTLKGLTPADITAKSLVNLINLLGDKIEYKLINGTKIELIKNFPAKREVSSQLSSKLNTKLLFTEDLTELPMPGNLYFHTDDILRKLIVEDLIDRGTFAEEYCQENSLKPNDFYEGPKIKPDHEEKFKKFGFKKVAEIVKEATYIQIELTPICDYSQNNRKLCRLVSGVILPEQYMFKKKRNADYFYMSPSFVSEGQAVNFYCDFRYVWSVNPDTLKGVKPKIRIRHLFQTEIQSHLARQVSRPGLVSL